MAQSTTSLPRPTGAGQPSAEMEGSRLSLCLWTVVSIVVSFNMSSSMLSASTMNIQGATGTSMCESTGTWSLQVSFKPFAVWAIDMIDVNLLSFMTYTELEMIWLTNLDLGFVWMQRHKQTKTILTHLSDIGHPQQDDVCCHTTKTSQSLPKQSVRDLRVDLASKIPQIQRQLACVRHAWNPRIPKGHTVDQTWILTVGTQTHDLWEVYLWCLTPGSRFL